MFVFVVIILFLHRCSVNLDVIQKVIDDLKVNSAERLQTEYQKLLEKLDRTRRQRENRAADAVCHLI